MADINLNIGTDELDKLKKLLSEIQKAADKLKKTIEAAGAVTDDDVGKAKRLAAEHKKIENALKREELVAQKLAVQQENINTKTRETKGIIGSLEKETRDWRSALKSASTAAEMKTAQAGLRKTTAALAKAKGTTASWGKALGSFQFKFNALGNIAANVFSKITSGMTQFIKESVKMAAAAEGIDRAFRKLNDPNLLKNLRDATRGTVSDVLLMTAAVKANNFKIPLEQLPKFFEFASMRAIETGESVDYLVESIVNGIARKSLPILDNLGLSATEVREEMAKTGDMAKAVANIIARDMGGANRPLATTAELYAQATANADNMKVQFGQIANLFGAKLIPHTQKFVNFLKDALMTQAMIQRQVLDASMVWQIEQDKAEVLDLSNRLKEKGVKLEQGQTYEQRASLLLLEQYKALLVETGAEDVKRVESLAAQIKSLELMAGITPEEKAILSESQLKSIQDQEAALERMAQLLAVMADIDAGGPAERMAEALKGVGEGIGLDESFFDEWLSGFDEVVDDMVPSYEKIVDGVVDGETKKQQAINKTYDTAKQGLDAISNLFEANKQKELSAVGSNEEKRLAIEKKYRKKQQAIAIAMTIINTAEGVVKALKDYGLPWGLIPAAAMAALGAVEIATIKSQTFAKGGPVLGEPHSRGGVQLEAEGGEYIINKKSTGKYKNLIDAINQDDQVRIMDAMSRDRKIVISQVDPYTQKMYDLMRSQPVYGEDNEFYYKHKGNMLIKTKKR